jgi:hypothetical protein
VKPTPQQGGPGQGGQLRKRPQPHGPQPAADDFNHAVAANAEPLGLFRQIGYGLKIHPRARVSSFAVLPDKPSSPKLDRRVGRQKEEGGPGLCHRPASALTSGF